VYELDAPNAEQETLDTCFMLLREIASHLTITPAAVDRERGVVLSEERTTNTPAFRGQQALFHALYPGARFTDRAAIGLTEVIQNTPAQRIRDFYESYYRPERAFFVISGDFDVDRMEEHIRQTFGDWRPVRPDPGNPQLGSGANGSAGGYFYDPGAL